VMEKATLGEFDVERERARAGLASRYGRGSGLPFLMLDPLSRKLSDLRATLSDFNRFVKACPSLTSEAETKANLELMAAAVDSFEHFVDELSKNEEVPLANLMASRALIERAAEHSLMAMALASQGFQVPELQRDCLLKETTVEVQALLSTFESITVEHLTVERHLFSLIVLAMQYHRRLAVWRSVVIFRPVLLLREELFRAPRPGLLREYLTKVEKLQASLRFRRLAKSTERLAYRKYAVAKTEWDGWKRELQKTTLELEVLALLDEA